MARPDKPARVARVLAYLESKGAHFEAVPGYPGWYAARWEDFEQYSDPQRWACSIDIRESDRPYALEFKRRAEMQVAHAA